MACASHVLTGTLYRRRQGTTAFSWPQTPLLHLLQAASVGFTSRIPVSFVLVICWYCFFFFSETSQICVSFVCSETVVPWAGT